MQTGKPQSPGESLRAVRLDKWKALQEEGRDPFRQTRFVRTHVMSDVRAGYPGNDGLGVRVAGRVTAIRRHGGAAFLDVEDASGRLQLHVERTHADAFTLLDRLDLGDHVGAIGTVFQTRRGEVTVSVQELIILAKSLRGLPDKRDGLKDVDARYRQRYLDLLANPDVRDVFRMRSDVVRLLREFLGGESFVEVETPILLTLAGGAEARPFTTHHNALDVTLYLRIAMELHLKRLIVGGYEAVYEIGRVFRNEGIDTRHSPEFTMLELYWAYHDYEDMMDLVERMVAHIVSHVRGSLQFDSQGHRLDFTPPWPRVDLTERFQAKTGVSWFDVATKDEAYALARRFRVEVQAGQTRGQILDKITSQLVEPDLIGPTFLIHHPVDISPLAKCRAADPRLTERFEAFCLGRELGNAFSELNDPVDQRRRFEDQQEDRRLGNDEVPELDEDYLTALEYGLPPTAGLGIGIERLMMVVAGVPAIRDVIWFPVLRPL
ncbi:MAG: lysine--tRNA ligase [Firmicutes bacterium]|nr:lysine--tRNA ligase [Bacillota bacterium]